MTDILTARRLITESETIEYPVVEITPDGRIAAIYSDPHGNADECTVLTAAFFDIHIHGAVGADVMNSTPAETARMRRFLAAHGVAHYLPTTVTAPVDFTLRALETMANVIEGPQHEGEATPLGIHIEGPFLSHAKRGMHPADDLQPPSIELFEKLQTAARGHIRLMTLAPEPDAVASDPRCAPVTSVYRESSPIELIRYVAERGVRCSIGHTNATGIETLRAIEAGAVSATHTFNAMRPLDHREPGVLGTVLDDDRLFADLICDGVHVAAPLVRLWLKAKGPGRAILITDSLSATGMRDGSYIVGDTTVEVRGPRALVAGDLRAGKETLAGSVLTLDHAVAKLCEFTGASLGDASRLASHNPATMLGYEQLTSLAVGNQANLNRYDSAGKLIATYLRGKQVPKDHES